MKNYKRLAAILASGVLCMNVHAGDVGQSAQKQPVFFAGIMPDPKDPNVVDKLKNMPFDRAETERFWTYVMTVSAVDQYTLESKQLGLTSQQIAGMADNHVKALRTSYTDEEFDKELRRDFDSYKNDLVAVANDPNYRAPHPGPFPPDKNTPRKEDPIGLLIKWLPGRVAANFDAAKNERGEIAKGVMATTGISVDAIQEHGIGGGENSVFHKNLGLPW